MSGGHVVWLADRVLCPEEVLISSELEFDTVISLGLESHDEVPDALRTFLLMSSIWMLIPSSTAGLWRIGASLLVQGEPRGLTGGSQ